MNNLDRYILSKYTYQSGDRFEGNIFGFPEQQVYFKELMKSYTKPVKVLEVGFNAGHSSVLFLDSNKKSFVTSFDIGSRVSYIGKKYIDMIYPNRHSLIVGDSNTTIPLYNDRELYDVVFIDGDCSYNGVLNDLINCKKFAHSDTELIVNGISENENSDINKAWNKMISDRTVKSISSQVFRERGWATGRYLF